MAADMGKIDYKDGEGADIDIQAGDAVEGTGVLIPAGVMSSKHVGNSGSREYRTEIDAADTLTSLNTYLTGDRIQVLDNLTLILTVVHSENDGTCSIRVIKYDASGTEEVYSMSSEHALTAGAIARASGEYLSLEGDLVFDTLGAKEILVVVTAIDPGNEVNIEAALI